MLPDQDSDDGQFLSADENDHDPDDLESMRLGKRKRPISVSYVVPPCPALTCPALLCLTLLCPALYYPSLPIYNLSFAP
jgi:hypothetical protein